jgi:hypothetical protein
MVMVHKNKEKVNKIFTLFLNLNVLYNEVWVHDFKVFSKVLGV